jgi:hypothetical protein
VAERYAFDCAGRDENSALTRGALGVPTLLVPLLTCLPYLDHRLRWGLSGVFFWGIDMTEQIRRGRISLHRGVELGMVLLIGGLALAACGTKSSSGESSQAIGEPLAECVEYARRTRECFASLGVPATSAADDDLARVATAPVDEGARAKAKASCASNLRRLNDACPGKNL